MDWKIHQLCESPLSAAQFIAKALLDQGIERHLITDTHLQEFYQSLDSIHSSGNLSKRLIQLPKLSAPINENITAAIVETRSHRNLEFVVCQCAEALNIPIQIFHGDSNKSFITNSAIGQLIQKGQVTLTNLKINTLKARAYNHLLLSHDFWDALLCRNKILIFQTDSVLCHNSDFTLNDFMSFDYIGSKWAIQRPIGIKVDGGNGGFSLRDWKKSKECLNRFPSQLWPGGEDGYFAFHLDIIGAKVGRPKECAKFSSQGDFTERSFACHSIHLMRDAILKKFLKYAPEAKTILPRSRLL